MPPACRNCRVEKASRSTPMVDTHCGSKVWPRGNGRVNMRTASVAARYVKHRPINHRLMLRAGTRANRTDSRTSSSRAMATRAVMKPRHGRANGESAVKSTAPGAKPIPESGADMSGPRVRAVLGAAIQLAIRAGQGIGARQVDAAHRALHHVLRLRRG